MSSLCEDNAFGPTISGCRSDFDFTLLFEQSILSIAPAALLLLLAPPRLVKLFRSRTKTLPTPIRSLKAVATLLLIAVQLALLVLWVLHQETKASVASGVLSFLASVAICVLSAFEHSRGIRPSLLLNVYLLVSVVFDTVQVRTLYLRKDDNAILGLFATSIGIKTTLLLLEAQSKRNFLKPPYNQFSPETTSGIFNSSFVWWINPLLATGFRGVLTLQDLFATDQTLLSEPLQDRMQKVVGKVALLTILSVDRSSGKYALVYAIAYCLKWNLALIIFPRLCQIAFNYAQPFIISSAVAYVSQPSRSKNDGYGLMAATGLVYLGIAISTAHYQHQVNRMVTSFRGAMLSLIYARTLKLQAGIYDESAALTLMSTDIDRLVLSLQGLNNIWADIIQLAIGIWLLSRNIGWVCIAPVVIVVACVYAASYVARFIGARQKVWTAAIQQRVGMTSVMLSSMKSVKMMGLTDLLFNTLQNQRIRELELSKRFRVMGIWRMSISFLPETYGPMAAFIIFAIKASANNSSPLTLGETFSSFALISLLTSPAEDILNTIPQLGMATGCLQRIHTFLLVEPHEDRRVFLDNDVINRSVPADEWIELRGMKPSRYNDAVTVENATIRPSKDAQPLLQNISFKAHRGSITMIVGVVGSGKSTLLKALIGELGLDSGSITVASKHAAYCAQTPWLLNATVRQIICGPSEEVSQDEEWYRAVTHACAFDEDLMQLPDRDDTLIGSRGVVLSGGQKARLALARAVYARQDIVVLDDIFSAIDSRTEDQVVERLFSKNGLFRRLGSTVILATHAIRHLPLGDSIIVLGADGRIAEQGSFNTLRSQNGFVSKVVVQPGLLESGASDNANSKVKRSSPIPKALRGPSPNDIAERTRRIGDSSVYRYYLSSMGWRLATISALTAVVYTLALKLPYLWLNWYASGNVKGVVLFSTIYAAFAIIATLTRAYNLYILHMKITPKTGAGLHKILLRSVMHAPQSFFDETDAGVTLNRFSQDMTLIDGSLPGAAVIFFSAFMGFLAQIALVAIGSSYMAIIMLPILIGVYFLQKFYLRTSRQIRFLDLEQTSPLYTHFLETLEGLSTIRAFGWQDSFTKNNIQRLDDSQKPSYLMLCIQRWLALVLRLCVATIAFTVITLAVNIQDSTTSGRLGVSMSTIVTFGTSLSYVLQFWAMLETSLGAIARLKAFQEGTVSEDKPEETFIPGSDWPSAGAITFDNVSASYGPDSPALRNISFTIQPGEKIGICGRTGSGKSSLISVLLRILDIETGTMKIDGVDLSRVPRSLIRSRITTIPQDPFLLAGSVRLNADPTSLLPDSTIIIALTKVGLWDVLSARGGLDASMMTNPLSQGQAQIFCLARAMLRQGSRILVLDEATSNVDAETDVVMQRLIREEFRGWTVVMVAHRLDTIMDSDRIAVLDRGRIVEFDKPEVLMGRKSALEELGRGRV